MPLFGNKKAKLLTAYADKVLADDVLTADEEASFLEHAKSIGIESLTKYPVVLNRLVIARVNSGRLPVLEEKDIRLVAKPGESVHLETEATLLKEVVVREWRGSGFSFPIAKGIRYRTGRGQMHAVGTRVEVSDMGVLSVTSNRVVFAGRRKTQESLYAKLASLNVFSDGVSIGVTNRQTVSTYKLQNTSGEVVAAVINAAMQKAAT